MCTGCMTQLIRLLTKKRRAVIFNQGGLALFLFPETLKKQLPSFEIYMVQFVHSTYSFLSLLSAMCLSDN